MDETHLKVRHTCDQCGHSSRRKAQLRRHKQTIHQGIVFSWKMFPFTYTQSYTLRGHLWNFHEENVCDSCNITLNSYNYLKKHNIKAHTKTEKCYVCHFKGFDKQDVKEHIKLNHPEFVLSCTKCNYLTIKKPKKNLIKHESLDHNISCTQCTYKTISKRSLVIHEKNHHNMQTMIKCDKCYHLLDTKKSLYIHTLLDHTFRNKMFNYLNQFERLHTSFLGKHKILLVQS